MIRLPVILGPTAVGKTEVALTVAEELKGEILSADSRQIYKGMDIGTAKPTSKEQKRIKHHLIDLVSPDCHYSSGDYARDAWNVLQNFFRITNHQSPITEFKVPLLVGGSGLYILALIKGYFEAPPVNLQLRKRLEEEDLLTLYQRLKKVDPEASEKIHPHDRQRITRALEVYEQTGIPMSKLQRQSTKPCSEPEIASSKPRNDRRGNEADNPDSPFAKPSSGRSTKIQTFFIGLTREREDLYRRIDERVDRMIKEGFVEEVDRLLKTGYSPDLEAFKAVGYREMSRYLNGEISKEEAVSLTKRNTRQYAKRQMTWFRGIEGVEWIPLMDHSNPEKIAREISNRISDLLKGS